MKAIFVAYNQALNDDIIEAFEKVGVRGFTKWESVTGRGTCRGEPHFGTHTWPIMNSAMISIVEDHQARPILDLLKAIDESAERQGMRAYALEVADTM